jgi:hypothetical protein
MQIITGKKFKMYPYPITIFAIIVFFTPVIMQVTYNNKVKLLEDISYVIMCLLSLRVLIKKRAVVHIHPLLLFLTISLAIFSLVGIFYNGIAMILIQFRELKYLLLPLILLPYYEYRQFNSIWPLLKVIAALSVPISILQWYKFRSNGDQVTGMMGLGGSGTLTLFLSIVFFSELVMRLKNSKNIFGLYFIFLIPTAINETKIVIVLLPIMLISTLFLTKKLNIKNIIIMAVVFSILFSGWAFMYKSIYKNSITEVISTKFLSSYLYNTKWDNDMGRFDKIEYSLKFIKGNNMFFGFGLGASYYGASSGAKGYILEKYYSDDLFNGTRPQIFVSLIEVGILGFIFIFAMILFVMLKILKMSLDINKAIAFNAGLVIIISMIYQPIFYTYQIMYIFVLYSFLCFRFNLGVNEKTEVKKTDVSLLYNT